MHKETKKSSDELSEKKAFFGQYSPKINPNMLDTSNDPFWANQLEKAKKLMANARRDRKK